MRRRPRIPTAISAAETRFLERTAEGKRVVECGALLGYSTIVLAGAASRLTSIDRHAGYGPSTERAFRSHLQTLSATFVDVRIGDATALVAGVDADLAFLDLDGTESTTRRVLAQLRSGWALVHDVGRQRCAGVERAIAAAGFRIVEAVDTLALCHRIRA